MYRLILLCFLAAGLSACSDSGGSGSKKITVEDGAVAANTGLQAVTLSGTLNKGLADDSRMPRFQGKRLHKAARLHGPERSGFKKAVKRFAYSQLSSEDLSCDTGTGTRNVDFDSDTGSEIVTYLFEDCEIDWGDGTYTYEDGKWVLTTEYTTDGLTIEDDSGYDYIYRLYSSADDSLIEEVIDDSSYTLSYNGNDTYYSEESDGRYETWSVDGYSVSTGRWLYTEDYAATGDLIIEDTGYKYSWKYYAADRETLLEEESDDSSLKEAWGGNDMYYSQSWDGHYYYADLQSNWSTDNTFNNLTYSEQLVYDAFQNLDYEWEYNGKLSYVDVDNGIEEKSVLSFTALNYYQTASGTMSINGQWSKKSTPASCEDGSFSYETIEPIEYDSAGNRIGGELVLNGQVTIQYQYDGSMLVLDQNGEEISYTLDDLSLMCSY